VARKPMFCSTVYAEGVELSSGTSYLIVVLLSGSSTAGVLDLQDEQAESPVANELTDTIPRSAVAIFFVNILINLSLIIFKDYGNYSTK
jgi:hypothetical protein